MALAEAVPPAGTEVIVGAVVSLTVKVVVAVALLPAKSVAVTVMVWVPRVTKEPAAGLWVLVTALQLSAAMVPVATSGMGA